MPFHPFHFPRHQHNLSDPQFAHGHDNYHSTANAIYSAGHTLSSVGAPNPHWNDQNLPLQPVPITAPDSRSYPPQPNTNGNGNGTVIPYRPGPASGAYSGGQIPSDGQSGQYQSSLRRSLTVGRSQAEELRLSQQGTAMSDVHHYGAPPAYGGESLSIKIEPSTPQHPNSVTSNPVPGALQPGLASRPAPLPAANTAPTLPTLPQISTQLQQPALSARPTTLNHNHSYSRSSPGAMDQPKYKPFSNTPEQGKFTSTPNSYMPQTLQGPSSYSPLGLADIRTRTEPNFTDAPFSPGVAQENESIQYPQNSNYLAPWPIYAVDWCKWPPRSNNGSTGKVAIGSYLEDNHNFVRIEQTSIKELELWANIAPTDSDFRHTKVTNRSRQSSR